MALAALLRPLPAQGGPPLASSRLRPAWKWTSDCTGWEVHTEMPRALPSSEVQTPKPPSAAKAPPAKPPKPAQRSNSSGGSKATPSRRRGGGGRPNGNDVY